MTSHAVSYSRFSYSVFRSNVLPIVKSVHAIGREQKEKRSSRFTKDLYSDFHITLNTAHCARQMIDILFHSKKREMSRNQNHTSSCTENVTALTSHATWVFLVLSSRVLFSAVPQSSPYRQICPHDRRCEYSVSTPLRWFLPVYRAASPRRKEDSQVSSRAVINSYRCSRAGLAHGTLTRKAGSEVGQR